jgi:pimeloyl-ACP methyl ester carboxylesterase
VDGELLACGYSFGAAAALRAGVGHPRVTRLILVAPPPSLWVPALFERFAGRALVVAGGADPIAPARELEALAARGRRTQLAVIPDADDSFMTGLAELGREIRSWLGPTGSAVR